MRRLMRWLMSFGRLAGTISGRTYADQGRTSMASRFGLVAEERRALMKWASDMTTEEIEVELAALNAKIDAFEAADPDDVSHGGSPGEGLYERYEELTTALGRRRAIQS